MSAAAEPISLSDLVAAAYHAEDAVPARIADAIVVAGRRLDMRGWVPATSGNISVRLDEDRIAITRSGCHKGLLEVADVMLVDMQGSAVSGGRPSAETLLHCQIYALLPHIHAVVHTHSVAATVLSRNGTEILLFQGYEIQKAFAGQTDHEAELALPVFDNDQDIRRLAARIAPHFASVLPGFYLIRGHGVYAWGENLDTAMARLEAIEFLLACELKATALR